MRPPLPFLCTRGLEADEARAVRSSGSPLAATPFPKPSRQCVTWPERASFSDELVLFRADLARDGRNAIFTGERMLTTPTSGWDEDHAMFSRWGMRGLSSFEGAALAQHEARQAAAAAEEEEVPVSLRGSEEVSEWASQVGVGEIHVGSPSEASKGAVA